MKVAVIVTNGQGYYKSTPIFICAMNSGQVIVNGGFIVDFDAEVIQNLWGYGAPMQTNEALKFGANFGLWFQS